jgi:hypothetical protein
MPDRDPIRDLRKMHTQLVRRRPMLERVHRYYDGDHNLAFASEKFLEAFGGLFDAFADNWCQVVADAPEERMSVQGFRVADEVKVDDDAKRFWEENDMDLQAGMGHLDGIIGGAFYTTVWVGDKDNVPEITVESAANATILCHPKNRRRRTAGLRAYLDDDGFEHAELFYPDEVYLFRSRTKRTAGGISDPMRLQWDIEDMVDAAKDLDSSGRMVNPLGKVPIVEFVNRPRLTTSRRAGWATHSELGAVIPIQDAVNKLFSDLLVASEFAAYPQRHLTGYEPVDELDPETGKPTGRTIDPNFVSGPGKVWWLEDPEAKFGSFDVADLGGLVSAIDMTVQHIASISATPPHYLSASADRLSGESIKSAESGLIAKTRRKCRTWGAGWEEVMRLAGGIANKTDLEKADSMETVWADIETRTESEHMDALSKKKELDVPTPQLWEEMGYGPDTVKRFPGMRAQMQLEGMAANAAESARLAQERADLAASQSVDATGGLPTATGAP